MKEPPVLDSTSANTIYMQLNRLRAADPALEPLITDLWRCCLRYAAIRTEWPLMTVVERHAADARPWFPGTFLVPAWGRKAVPPSRLHLSTPHRS